GINLKFGDGYIHRFLTFQIQDGKFIPFEPINNLVMTPNIIFNKDPRLNENIDLMWQEIAKRLAEENEGTVDFDYASLFWGFI
ncbi:MAG: hypothetical protein IH840_17860, partial [Candidatus Heimdallarchaeota archaeon]|nr:hypothetical protein [Candidatus Heimdallarchaeota archaeon]